MIRFFDLGKARGMTAIVFALFLTSCIGMGSQYWLENSSDEEVQIYLESADNNEICRLQNAARTPLAVNRVTKEYNKRGLTKITCSPAYPNCISYGYKEGTPEFNECIGNTEKMLRLERDMEEMRRDYRIQTFERCTLLTCL